MKFDKVIMNPPYKEGNLIWRISKKKSNIIVSLMPLTRYKGGKIYEYIQDFTFIENNFDAYVAKNNCITISQKNRNNNQKYLDLLFHTFDENLYKVYEYNFNHFKGLKIIRNDGVSYKDLDIEKDFIESSRSSESQNITNSGYSKKGCGYKYNVDRKGYEEKWIYGVALIHFDSPKQKNNFSRWWYYGNKGEKLSSLLLMGMNLRGIGYYHSYAIPQIDWDNISEHPFWKEGKYDEAVLDAMGLRWEDDSKIKIVKKD